MPHTQNILGERLAFQKDTLLDYSMFLSFPVFN